MSTIRKRFITTLINRLIALFSNVVTAGIVPRALGAENYGNYQFLMNAFYEIKNMLDLGTSSAFFTKSSQEEKSGTLIALFAIWEIVQNLLIFAFIGISLIVGFQKYLWPGQSVSMIYLLSGIAVLQIMNSRLSSFADTKALTVVAQGLQMTAPVLQLSLILLIFFSGHLNIWTYISVIYVVTAYSLLFLFLYMYRIRNKILENDCSRQKIKEIVRYFLAYCAPLVAYAMLGLAYGYFNRWFLQIIGGSAQQGYFSLAFNWSQIIMIFTISMVPVFWREISNAHGTNDIDRIKFIYNRFIRILFCITSVFAAFICVNSDFLVLNIAGKQFSGAIWPLILISLYPVYQTCGQVSSVLFLAMGRTRIYRNIGILTMFLGTAMTYFLIAPRTYFVPGLDLGANGLGIQMLTFNYVTVNIYMYFNCRLLEESYLRLVVQQFYVLGSLIIIAMICKALFMEIYVGDRVIVEWAMFIASGLSFLTLSMIFTYANPKSCGIRKDEISGQVHKYMSYLKIKRI